MNGAAVCTGCADAGAGRADLERLRAALGEQLVRAAGPKAGGGLVVERLGAPATVRDATTKGLVRGEGGEPLAVIVWSSPESPGLIARGARNAAAVRECLGAELGSVVLAPLAEGELDGRTYVVLPYMHALESGRIAWRVQRRRVGPRVLAWVHGAAAAMQRGPTCDAACAEELRWCEESELLDAGMRSHAAAAMRRLERGEWRPRHCVDHNDLWKDNILLRPPGEQRSAPYPFVLIDWAGANPRGYGFYDLLRFCRSFGLSAGERRREVLKHCAAIGCGVADAPSHLLSSLGWLGRHREHFPAELYAASAKRCWRELGDAVHG